jgi:hypothetical protein
MQEPEMAVVHAWKTVIDTFDAKTCYVLKRSNFVGSNVQQEMPTLPSDALS